MKHHIDRLGIDVTVPRGWRVVKRGKEHIGDMAWDKDTERFTLNDPKDAMRLMPKAYYCLIRKEPR